MTPMDRRDKTAKDMAMQVASEALSDAGLSPSELGLVVLGNALGGRLSGQECIRGQAWLRDAGFEGAPVVNVDNSCAGGSTALHVGIMASLGGESPVLVLGVEKMWTGDRSATLSGIEDGVVAEERAGLRSRLDCGSGSVLMGLNATWVREQIEQRGTTVEEIAATTVKARRCAGRNPLAQFRDPLTVEEVLASAPVAGPLTRLMCSSFTDGAAAVVVSRGSHAGSPRVRASVARSGSGELDYHDRLAATADEAWKASGLGPSDVDLIELHDATSAEELYALESLGFFSPGAAGRATAAGETDVGGNEVTVNPSGGLVARGHPVGATGVVQVVEVVEQLRGSAGARQVESARIGVAVNTGGIVGGDTAFAAVHVLEGA